MISACQFDSDFVTHERVRLLLPIGIYVVLNRQSIYI